MVLDYCERRPVSKNRPKKQPIGLIIVAVVGAVLISFIGGFASGWFMGGRSVKKEVEKAAAAAKSAEAASAVAQPKPESPVVPLTFYQTLPKGAKAVIGSGLNPAKTGEGQPTAAQTPEAVGANGNRETNAGTPPKTAGQLQSSGEGTFAVQIASMKDRKEADAIKERLSATGHAAYIVESNLQAKGIWYRVRIGKHLKQKEAGELAVKAGKGAIVVAE